MTAEIEAASMARELVALLLRKGSRLALAESCTAGLVADLIARNSGASGALWGSFVCYTPEAKARMLGLDPAFMERHGLVSAEVAREMALGALRHSGADVAAGVTGIAGPSGDGGGAPVGAVRIAVALEGRAREKGFLFSGDRAAVRMQAARATLAELLSAL
ncbi:MAG: CinA family protein [Treponema sp.]|nr:CinA family protein [Treponema sp.]